MHSLLLETDQIHCYDQSGTRISCKGTCQDASFPKRLPYTDSRFQIQADTILDTITGLLWSRDANPAGFPLTWEEAKAFVAGMTPPSSVSGYGAWQLPSRRMLFSLLSHQFCMPALPAGHPFTNVFSGYYWTGDSSSRFYSQAWRIDVGGARVPRADKTDSSLVWPVSVSTNALSAPDFHEWFIVSGSIVHDRLTGLIWSRDADIAGQLGWQQALDTLKRWNEEIRDGSNHWRLPNIRELESLISLSDDSPALPKEHPFYNVRDVYWSSTTSVYETRYAWALYTRDGMVGVGFKSDGSFHLWSVRGS